MSNLRIAHIFILKEYGIKDISNWKFIKADAESYTFKNIVTEKRIVLRR